MTEYSYLHNLHTYPVCITKTNPIYPQLSIQTVNTAQTHLHHDMQNTTEAQYD